MPRNPPRSISISGATYARLAAYCRKHQISMPQLIEALTADIPEHP